MFKFPVTALRHCRLTTARYLVSLNGLFKDIPYIYTLSRYFSLILLLAENPCLLMTLEYFGYKPVRKVTENKYIVLIHDAIILFICFTSTLLFSFLLGNKK